MSRNQHIVALIPARCGSKGVPDKNIREINKVSLLEKTIIDAKESKHITKVVVSTDSFDYAEKALDAGADIAYLRNAELATDETTISEVAYDFMQAEDLKTPIDVLVILQPTSPLRTVKDIDNAIELWIKHKCDTVISVEDARGLYWRGNPLTSEPAFVRRVNRQQMPPIFKETGAVVVTKHITKETTIGKYVILYPMRNEYSIDVDTFEDLWIANVIAQRRRYVIHFKAYSEIGYGHLYRSLTFAERLYHHDVTLICSEYDEKAVELLQRQPFKVIFSKVPTKTIKKLAPDILINDILDTNKTYMRKGFEIPIVVNLEDKGEGAEYATFVFNAMYRGNLMQRRENTFYGAKYAVVSNTFEFRERIAIKKDLENVLITFGGTDPNNITQAVINNIPKEFPDVNFTFIVGPGFTNKCFQVDQDLENVNIIGPVIDMAEEMSKADIIITSGGRTVFEAGCCGVPCIVSCQNDREMTHMHLKSANGVYNTGLYNEKTIQEFEKSLRLLKAQNIRQRAQEAITKMVDGMGVYRILGMIEKEWRKHNE